MGNDLLFKKGIDFDFILFGIGELVSKASDSFGSKSISIKIENKEIVLDRPVENPCEPFDHRLNGVLKGARLISKYNNIKYENIVGILLVLDGWSWNEYVFRSPVWMNDHQEIPIRDARKIRGLEWVIGSSLEIKLEQYMEWDGLEG